MVNEAFVLTMSAKDITNKQRHSRKYSRILS